MISVGYGICKNGKPYGIWPSSLSHIRGRITELAKEAERTGTKYTIHEIFKSDELRVPTVIPAKELA